MIPLDLGIEEITSSGIGLVFSEATAFHFMKNNKIHYSVQIRPKHKKTSNIIPSAPPTTPNILLPEPSAPPLYLVNEIGKKHALNKYEQFIRNTSCFGTMSDFSQFWSHLCGTMHCLPQWLKSTFFEIFSNEAPAQKGPAE